jgi:Rrf2 family protein
MGGLTHAGLVRSHRGKEGGFSLAVPAEETTVKQVLDATEGPFEISACVGHPEICTRTDTCPAHPLWAQVTEVVNHLLERTTIAELAGQLKAKAESATGSHE